MVDAPILAPTTFGGIADTFGIVEEEAAAQPARSAAVTLELAAFRGGLAAIDTDSALSLEQAMSSLTGLQTHAANLLAAWPAPSDMAPGDRHWPQALSDACTGAVEALALFFRTRPCRAPARRPAGPSRACGNSPPRARMRGRRGWRGNASVSWSGLRTWPGSSR